ncbi:hypothetical protein GGR50DRAFT_647734 [Xylaria sp. CBS 124048]|nr:hypothetical protein GGR50DRAFT_647734 [Xylaria sp. CBS 124048]
MATDRVSRDRRFRSIRDPTSSGTVAERGASALPVASSRHPIFKRLAPTLEFKVPGVGNVGAGTAGTAGAGFSIDSGRAKLRARSETKPAEAAPSDAAVSSPAPSPAPSPAIKAPEPESRAIADDKEGGTQSKEVGKNTSGTEMVSLQTSTAESLALGPSLEHDDEDAGINPSLSDRVQIIGMNAHARFVAHALASIPTRPPIAMFAAHPVFSTAWSLEDRSLILYDAQARRLSSAEIECPERIFNRLQRFKAINDLDFLDNVVLSTRHTAVLPSIRNLRHRMDGRTTICVLHLGLGLAEQIAEIFQDREPLDRPNFILAHSSHHIANVPYTLYSIQHKVPGTIHLCGVPKSDDPYSAVAREGRQHIRHMMKLLSSTSGLNVTGLPYPRFLASKLPRLVFSALADAISVILGCSYNQIRRNPHTVDWWEELADESVAIIKALPELQCIPYQLEKFTRPSFKRKLRQHLLALGTGSSPWIRQVRLGMFPPVDYFNGYLVRRAEELGIDHQHHSTAIRLVKARTYTRQMELRNSVGSLTGVYMTDLDVIGGGQPAPTIEELMESDELW